VNKPDGYVVVVKSVTWGTRELAEGHKLFLWQTLDRNRYTFTVEPIGATPTDAGLREAVTPLLNEIMSSHRDIQSPDYNECEITECQWCFEARAALSQGGGE